MPYRHPGAHARQDARVVCVRCAAPSGVSLATMQRSDFTCGRCHLGQPVLPELGDAATKPLDLVSADAGSYTELAPIAAELGRSATPLSLRLSQGGMELQASLSINSGVVMGLDLVAPNGGLPSMRLVAETTSHVAAKERGVVREAQTGDPRFDQAVYIESSARDQAIRVVFASPAVRAAAVALLAVADAIVVDTSVRVHVSKSHLPFEPARLRQLVGWLRIVAGAPRPVAIEEAPDPLRVTLTKVGALSLAPLAILALVLGLVYYPTAEVRPVLLAGIGGLVAVAALQPLFTWILRGRSTSHHDILIVRVATLVMGPPLVAGVLMILNAVLDRSPERIGSMPIVRVQEDNESSTLFHVTAIDDKNRSHTHAFEDVTVTTLDRMIIGWRDGAFGWEWESRGPTLTQHTR